MGRIDKGVKCSVCGKEAARSLSAEKVKASGLSVHGAEKRAYLCKEHYKEINKIRKSDEKLIQKKGFLDDSRASKKGKYTDDI